MKKIRQARRPPHVSSVAVQPGRQITSIHTHTGLGVPVAEMSADERSTTRPPQHQ